MPWKSMVLHRKKDSFVYVRTHLFIYNASLALHAAFYCFAFNIVAATDISNYRTAARYISAMESVCIAGYIAFADKIAAVKTGCVTVDLRTSDITEGADVAVNDIAIDMYGTVFNTFNIFAVYLIAFNISSGKYIAIDACIAVEIAENFYLEILPCGFIAVLWKCNFNRFTKVFYQMNTLASCYNHAVYIVIPQGKLAANVVDLWLSAKQLINADFK